MTDAVLLGMGGSSLAPEVFRRSSPPSEGALRLHVLDSTEPLEVAGRRRADRPGADAVHRLVEVGRDDRAERAAGVLPLAPARSVALRRDHRPGHLDGRAGRRRGVPPHVPFGPGDRRALLGAVAVRDRPGGARRRRRPGGARGRPGRGRELQPAAGQLRPLARRGDRRARPARPRQADVRRRPADRVVRDLGRAARGGVDGQAREGRAADRRRAARGRRRRTGRTACSCTCATRTRPTRGTPRPCARSRRPATRRSASPRAAPATSAACSSTRSSRPRSRAGRSGSTRSTSRTCRRRRTTPPRCSTRARPRGSPTARSRSCSTGSGRRITSPSWATCPTTGRPRPRSRACARR